MREIDNAENQAVLLFWNWVAGYGPDDCGKGFKWEEQPPNEKTRNSGRESTPRESNRTEETRE